MPGSPLAKGIIITVSVLVAAGVAAYENPQIREWVDRSTQKVAMAFRSLGDDLNSRRTNTAKQDASMHEDLDEKAEERRRAARAEILERGRVMEERKKRRKLSNGEEKRTPSFDSLVDDEGSLRPDVQASTSAVEPLDLTGEIHSRRNGQSQQHLHQSVDAPMLLRQLDFDNNPIPAASAIEPWESQYEQEMRTAWSLPLSDRQVRNGSTHASESLIDLTPTTDEIPDPDFSIPTPDNDGQHPLDRTEYFSAAASNSSHTLSESEPEYYYAHPSHPIQTLEPRPFVELDQTDMPVSSAASVADSGSSIHHSEFESEDDMLSELGDGIRTPGSVWTEVGSTVSGDA